LASEENVVRICRSLIRTPSLSCKEKEVADIIIEEMENEGFDEIQKDPLGSVMGIMKGKREGKKVLFDAHIDHVGIGAENEWHFTPYGGETDDGKLYGRGTSDMKGSLAAMISGIGILSDIKENFSGEIAVSASVMEEVTEGVGLSYNLNHFRPDYVIIGESSNLKIICGQRGRAEIEINVYGESAHSSSPELGVNAVEDMMLIINQLKNSELPEDNIFGKAHLVLTDIISSPYPAESVVPHMCRVTYDRRTLPGETEDKILADMRDQISSLKGKSIISEVKIVDAEYSAYTGEKVKFHKFIPAWVIDQNTFLVKKAREGVEKSGIKPEIGYYYFCTNGSHAAIDCKIPTIGFGPSIENLAHRVDEYIEINHLLLAEKGYRNIALSLLNE